MTPSPAQPYPRTLSRAARRRSTHRREVDREAADVPAVRVADDEDHTRLRLELLGGEPVDAPREIASALERGRRALVLDESRLDLALAQEQPRHEEPREVRAWPAEVRPDHEPVLLLLQKLLWVPLLHGLVLERGVPGGQDEPVEGRDHRERISGLVRHPPLPVEGVLGDRLSAHS